MVSPLCQDSCRLMWLKITSHSECHAIYREVDRAKHGINLFGKPFDWGLCTDEVKLITGRVKGMLHKTHPDKQQGFIEQFHQMTQCMVWIREGIPFPTDDISATGHDSGKHLPQ